VWQKVYNFKRVDVRGNLSMYGRSTTTWTTLGATARAGDRKITLAEPCADWDAGDPLRIAPSGVGETTISDNAIVNVSDDGLTVWLEEPLPSDHVGELANVSATDVTGAKVVDVRAVVMNCRWNVRVLGADDDAYDRASGTSAWDQGWGASVRGLNSEVVSKPGWNKYDPGYDVAGWEQLPAGDVQAHFARFERCGKGYAMYPDEAWDGVAVAACVTYSKEQKVVNVVGSHSMTAFIGGHGFGANYFATWPGNFRLNFRRNHFEGESQYFRPSYWDTHVVADNVFCAGTRGLPKGVLPHQKMISISGGPSKAYAFFDGGLVFSRNVVHGVPIAAVHVGLRCDGFRRFDGNRVVNSYIGYSIPSSGCSQMELNAHRNVIGAIVDGVLDGGSFAENAVGVLPVGGGWHLGGQILSMPLNYFDAHADLVNVTNTVFVGVLLDLQKFQTDCASFGTVSLIAEGMGVTLDDWDYSGVQRGGYGGVALLGPDYVTSAPAGKWLDVSKCAFVAYSSPDDACEGRAGVGIANEFAGVGQGSGAAGNSLGSQHCPQCVTSDLAWPRTPWDGRVAFSEGVDGARDFAKCLLYDGDGSVYGTAAGQLYKADLDSEWPPDILDDCQDYLSNYDDDPSFSKCPWFIRENEYLLGAAAAASRRGVPQHRQARGDVKSRTCDAFDGVATANHVARCSKDWVTLKFTVPKRVTSGSEVLFAPVLPVQKSKLQPEFNVSVCDHFDAIFWAAL